MKYNLKEITFLTFVRLDNEERIKNLRAMHDFYRKHCESYTHIIVEEDKAPKVLDHLHLHKDDVYIFTESQIEWNKCEGYNKGIKLAKTQYIVLNDVDVIIHPAQLIEAANKLKLPTAGLIYPFNGLFLCVTDEVKGTFCNSLEYSHLSEHFPPSVISYDGINPGAGYIHANKTEGEVLIGHVNSTGGCVVGRRDSLIKCSGYNPNFVGWGYEDDEIPWRMNKLGYSCGRISGERKPAWHLPHFDGTGSQKETQPNYSTNEKLYREVQNMDKDKLIQYIKTWRM